MSTIHTCTATWKGGACKDPIKAVQLCQNHYRQRKRGQPFRPVQARGKMVDRRALRVHAEAAELDRVQALGAARGQSASSVVREAIRLYLAQEDVRSAREAHEEAVAGLRRLPDEAPESSKLSAVERVGAAFDRRLQAEQALAAIRRIP